VNRLMTRLWAHLHVWPAHGESHGHREGHTAGGDSHTENSLYLESARAGRAIRL